jgi:cytoskeletal protein RodZ
MSDTDIYKKREAMPIGNKPEKKKRRRRSGTNRAFDDHSRKRRSKNSGLRRFLHLSRKSKNEKVIWISVGVLFIVILLIVGIWQFVILEYQVRQKEQSDDNVKYQRSISEMPGAPEAPGKEPLVK